MKHIFIHDIFRAATGESRESGKQTDVEGRDMRKRPEKHVKLLVDVEGL